MADEDLIIPSRDSTASISSAVGWEKRTTAISTNNFCTQRVGVDVFKRYDFGKEEIGAGGYGKVYVATDRQSGRKVAIKKVNITDPQKKNAFMKEVTIMQDLDHPHICRLLETYEMQRQMFFVMELCEGKEVFDRIMDDGGIAEHQTAGIIKQCSSALKYAHSKGVAHRDMKPENICFCSRDPAANDIKVIDWGLGFYFGQARMTSAVGSMTYAAPEVLTSDPTRGYEAYCDIWSLGVVAYVMLAGKPPFWGNQNEQQSKMKKEKYPLTGEPWQAISDEAKDFIAKTLKYRPTSRMTISECLDHPWMRIKVRPLDPTLTNSVLSNMREFSHTSHFFTVCVASVARQLDHKSLRDVHKVFCELDTNGDGVLDLNEMRTGFKKFFGPESAEYKEVEAIFLSIDLDGSGVIDYTEFCAASIGEHVSTQEDVLWAAFRQFDTQDDDGLLTKAEIKQVLTRADVNKAWSTEVCQEVVDTVFAKFDKNSDGQIDFTEWVQMMRDCAHRKALDNVCSKEEEQMLKTLQATEEPGIHSMKKAYDFLNRVDSTPTKRREQARTSTCGCASGCSVM